MISIDEYAYRYQYRYLDIDNIDISLKIISICMYIDIDIYIYISSQLATHLHSVRMRRIRSHGTTGARCWFNGAARRPAALVSDSADFRRFRSTTHARLSVAIQRATAIGAMDAARRIRDSA